MTLRYLTPQLKATPLPIVYTPQPRSLEWFPYNKFDRYDSWCIFLLRTFERTCYEEINDGKSKCEYCSDSKKSLDSFVV